MRPAGIEALAATRAFLEETILPGVAQEHRSEARAALKTLRALELELADLPRVLHAEIEELGELCAAAGAPARCGQAAGHLRAEAGPAPGLDLAELGARHADARGAATTAILALQERARASDAEAVDLLARFYAALGRHAERRQPWQAVFGQGGRVSGP